MANNSDSVKLQMIQNCKSDFKMLNDSLKKNIKYSFIRFSDGEIEIIRNRKLEIGEGFIHIANKNIEYSYPKYDFKIFNPDSDQEFRHKLIEAAQLTAEGFIKGIPAASNCAIKDRDLMIELNGGRLDNLTFADLLINVNYLQFRNIFLENLMEKSHITVIANYRANLDHKIDDWNLIRIPDNVFSSFKTELDKILKILDKIPSDSVVLSSASSFTNIIGCEIWKKRRDIWFIDIGTSLHDLLGLGFGIREYHQIFTRKYKMTSIKKIRYKISAGYRMNKW